MAIQYTLSTNEK